MRAAGLCCLVLSMRTLIRFSAGIGSMNSRCARGARLTKKSRPAVAEFARPSARHAPQRRRAFRAGAETRALVPADRNDDRGSEVRLRAFGRGRVEDSARDPATEREDAQWSSFRHFSARTRCRRNLRNAREQYVALVIHEMLPRVAEGQDLAEYCDIFCERGYFEHRGSPKRFSARRSEHGLRLRMHVDQLTNSGGALLAARVGRGDGGSSRANRRRAESPQWRRRRCSRSCCRVRFTRLGKTRYPRAREMIDAGLAVVLATDFNPGSSPTPSIPMILSLAARK